ncbi:acetate uptake transporter family protein [Streptomyces fagopyri]|uniref:hypothetical protein n=1 Tax=Streptomyces fagopyri TaxID=2662397 RepID=UPI0037FC65C0
MSTPHPATAPMGNSGDGAPADRQAQVRLMLRPIGTALPLGYLAFALGMIVLGGDSLGWFASEQVLVGVVLASYVFPLQLVATVMAFLGRDSVGAATLGLFTTSWLAFGLVDIISEPGSRPTVLGVFSIAFGVIVLGLAGTACRAKPLFAAVLVLCSARAVFDGLSVLTGSPSLSFVTGVVALVTTVAAAYLGFALLIEDAWPRPALPVLRRAAAASAMDGELTAARGGILASPGVRDQL